MSVLRKTNIPSYSKYKANISDLKIIRTGIEEGLTKAGAYRALDIFKSAHKDSWERSGSAKGARPTSDIVVHAYWLCEEASKLMATYSKGFNDELKSRINKVIHVTLLELQKGRN